MLQIYDSLLKGGTIVNQNGCLRADLGIRDGRIVAFGLLDETHAGQIVDCRGLHILPGVIDTHVHFRDPGNTHKESMESGSRAAVLGGVTAIFDMPNTIPQTTTESALAAKISHGRNHMHCDFSFFVGATKDNIEQLANLEWQAGCCGIKVFMGSSTGNLLLDDDDDVAAILRGTTRRVAFHCEDEALLRACTHLRVKGNPETHTLWRSAEAALMCTTRLLHLARKVERRVHLLHVSTAEEMSLLSDFRDIASVEVTPHHLTLEENESYTRLGTFAQVNPPLRNSAHQLALWSAVRGGLADVIGSDHAPHTRDEKNRPYPESPSGMPGVQTFVPVMLHHVHTGRLTLERFVDLTSAGPARLYGIAGKGRIAEGYDADLTIVDLKRQERLSDQWIVSECGWTAFDGMEVTGWPVGCYVRGRQVMWEGELVESFVGTPMRFTR
ncbi:MAG: dihydroorotase [Alphaproteobacteria bacterium]|nr:dihydroorotase [Alphaproteobacteria bacterium]